MVKNIRIEKADTKDVDIITSLAKTTFLESHSHSASEEDINAYVSLKFTKETLLDELANPDNLVHLIWLNDEVVGYSKIILNSTYPTFEGENHCKMERLYVLEKAHGSGIGQILFDFNKKLALKTKQRSVWLYTWVENFRAIRFYEKNNFKIVDKAEFQISPSHSNPNHIMQMFLE